MKKCIVLIPHQDDETNLVGNIMGRLNEVYEVYVVYSSIDNNQVIGEIRKSEAIEACSVWGIAPDHIVFFDYPDSPNRNGKHFFTEGERSIIDQLQRIFREYHPEVIIGIDFDFHSDHRMLSLALDEALGKLLRSNSNLSISGYGEKRYNPVILKGFAYDTAYYGLNDYCASELGDTRVKKEVLSNPSFEWDSRISIKSAEKNGYIWRKKAYKALKCHASQYAVLHAKSVINSDNVFWLRRADSLLMDNSTKIMVSSGDSKKLMDFMILDTDDIITEDSDAIDFSKANWKPDPDDSSPTIYITFDNQVRVDSIILHGSVNDKIDKQIHAEICVNEDIFFECRLIRSYGRPTVVKIGMSGINSIRMLFSPDDNIQLSEIEIFETAVSHEMEEIHKSLCRETMLYAKHYESFSKIMNLLNDWGFLFIVFRTRINRKIHNTFAKKKYLKEEL